MHIKKKKVYNNIFYHFIICSIVILFSFLGAEALDQIILNTFSMLFAPHPTPLLGCGGGCIIVLVILTQFDADYDIFLQCV